MTDKTDRRFTDRKADDEARPGDTQDDVPHHDQKRDQSLKDSMDASDPPSTAAPGDDGDPVPSSGFKQKEDR